MIGRTDAWSFTFLDMLRFAFLDRQSRGSPRNRTQRYFGNNEVRITRNPQPFGPTLSGVEAQ